MSIFDIILEDLKTLFEVRVIVKGKVDMQKSLYFMKELGHRVPFNYRWSKLGPYSYELANVLNRLAAQRYLKYTGEYELDERHFRFVKPNVSPKMKGFFFELEKYCNKNGLNDIDFIECAASLHFIYKNSFDKEKEAVFERLASLKPYRISAFEPLIEHAWVFLKEQDLLNS
jgi:uncharacterized protein YwgA